MPRRILTLTTVAAAGAAVLAGCGGSSTPTTTAAASSGRSGNGLRTAYRFSACMRAHGVPNFPDPQTVNHNGEHGISIDFPKQLLATPAGAAARQACQSLLPGPAPLSPAQVRARTQDFLAFASCMRAHSVSNFPDPSSSGDITVEMLRAAGVDVHAPNVQSAARTCLPAARGVITAQDVERVENGQ